MRVLITGATGYVGGWLALKAVEDGWETHVLVRSANNGALPASVRRWIYDGGFESVARCLSEVRPDVLIHLASAREPDCLPADPEPILSANLLFGAQLLEAMSAGECRHLINAGSYWEYDSQGRYAPNTLYAASKHAFQDLVVYYCLHRGLHAWTVVLYEVYGPRDRRGKLVPQLVTALKTGERVAATPGEQKLYFVYIDDVCAGFLKAAGEVMAEAAPAHRVYALRSNDPVRPRDVVQALGAISGRAVNVAWGQAPYRSSQIFEPVSSIRRLPGWEPAIDLAEGLRRIMGEACPEAE